MVKKLKNVAEIIFCILEKGNEEKKLLTAANLLEDNQISNIDIDCKFKKDESVIIKKNDILLKRINPTYVNFVSHIKDEIYAGNNLIIIRPKSIDAKYLAAILNNNIEKFTKNNSIGAIVPSIGRKEIEEFEIKICNKEQQILLGKYWFKSVEKRVLEAKKIELEKQKSIAIINKFINEIGGNKND